MRTIYFLLFSSILFAGASYAEVNENTIVVTGLYTSQDGRVDDRKFTVNLVLNNDGTFSGEMDAWVGIYLSNGSERVNYYKQKIAGKWSINNGIILLKESNRLLPQSSALESSNGLKVIVSK